MARLWRSDWDFRMVRIDEKLVRGEGPPAFAPMWSEHFAHVSQQKNLGAKISSPDPRLYFTQDANWDTTAVIGYDSTTQTWGVVQRYVYSPYGSVTILPILNPTNRRQNANRPNPVQCGWA